MAQIQQTLSAGLKPHERGRKSYVPSRGSPLKAAPVQARQDYDLHHIALDMSPGMDIAGHPLLPPGDLMRPRAGDWYDPMTSVDIWGDQDYAKMGDSLVRMLNARRPLHEQLKAYVRDKAARASHNEAGLLAVPAGGGRQSSGDLDKFAAVADTLRPLGPLPKVITLGRFCKGVDKVQGKMKKSGGMQMVAATEILNAADALLRAAAKLGQCGGLQTAQETRAGVEHIQNFTPVSPGVLKQTPLQITPGAVFTLTTGDRVQQTQGRGGGGIPLAQLRRPPHPLQEAVTPFINEVGDERSSKKRKVTTPSVSSAAGKHVDPSGVKDKAPAAASGPGASGAAPPAIPVAASAGQAAQVGKRLGSKDGAAKAFPKA